MKNNKKGFTLVELVIVVAVMAVLVAVAIPTIGSIKSAADSAVLETNCRTMESIIKLAEADINKNEAGANVAIQPAQVLTAINNAKLGITSGTYSYLNNGQVIEGSPAEGQTGIATWTFGTNGTATLGTGE